MKNSKQPINPTTNSNYNEQPHLVEVSAGLTKREYFAAMAMQGMIASGKYTEGVAFHPALINVSIEIADDLLAELEQTQ